MNTLSSDGLIDAINRAAVYAYTQMAGPNFLTEPYDFNGYVHHPNLIWRLGLCNFICDEMLHHLVEYPAAFRERRQGWHTRTMRLPFHEYIGVGDNFMADGTWQQMYQAQQRLQGLERPPEIPGDAPLILAGSHQEVAEQAQAYGITDPRILALWQPRTPDLPTTGPGAIDRRYYEWQNLIAEGAI